VFNLVHRRLRSLAGIACLCSTPAITQADTAEMLPAGIGKVRYQLTFGSADSGFDAGGHRKSLGDLYRSGLEANGLATSAPSVYHINTDGKLSFVTHDLYLQYGVTDNLGLGLWTYYLDQKVSYAADLVRDGGWPALPTANQSALRAATTAANRTQSSRAIGDTVIGYKQRLVGSNESKIRFAYYLGVRLPTGHVADPLKPGDLSTGGGQTDIGLWFAFDYQVTPQLLLNIYTRHEYQLSGKRDVLDPTNASRKLSQKFRPGFYNYLELKERYRIPGEHFDTDLELSGIYEHTATERAQAYDAATDSYRGGLQPVGNTASSLLTIQPQIGITLFPVSFKLYAGIPVRGRNSLAYEYVGIRFDAYW